MSNTANLDENARHHVFLAAAWIANVGGTEDDEKVDALCQLRKALDIEPIVARELHEIARGSALSPAGLGGG